MEDLIVHEFEKNARERVRAVVKEFKGRLLIELRAYYPTEDGQWKPTRRGLTLVADKAGPLLKAAEAIAAEVRRIEAETPHEGIDKATHEQG
ncbi:MAG: transcriptional coactivator p15/PC4 family protein [Elusimicrobia bacterium]|nr:transcriptional coactivator p15/PC4 family protein [Elusimicrobiota bacterium]